MTYATARKEGGVSDTRREGNSGAANPAQFEVTPALDYAARLRAGGPVLMRKDAPSAGAKPDAAKAAPQAVRAIVDDNAAGPLEPGQMTRSQFVARFREQATAVAREAMGPVLSLIGMPMLEPMFAQLTAGDAAAIENRARARSNLGPTKNAAAYLPPLCAAVRTAVVAWARGGDKDKDGPDGKPAPPPAPPDTGGGATSPSPEGSAPAVQQKEAQPGSGRDASPADVMARLGPGQRVDGGLAGRMGTALGRDVGDVVVHTDSRAASLAQEQRAHAFTVGNHVAFAAGQYRPGSLEGDALIAHELAHVVQQRGASGPPSTARAQSAQSAQSSGSRAEEEREADQVAATVLGRLHGGAREPRSSGAPTDAPQDDVLRAHELAHFAMGREAAMPAPRSGLALRRCDDKAPPQATPTTVTSPTTSPTPDPVDPNETLLDELKRTNKTPQDAINKVIGELGLNTGLLEGGTMYFQGMVGADVKGYGQTIAPVGIKPTAWRTNRLPKPNQKPYVKIFGPVLMKHGWGLLRSAIYHEYVHVKQWSSPKDLGEDKPLTGKNAPDDVGEVEAYSMEILSAEKHGVDKAGMQEIWDFQKPHWRKAKITPQSNPKLFALHGEAKKVAERVIGHPLSD